jgi:hypothetical protein
MTTWAVFFTGRSYLTGAEDWKSPAEKSARSAELTTKPQALELGPEPRIGNPRLRLKSALRRWN